MRLCEIFRTIIGESIYAGYPCTIVRFAGCNLRCSYCDTEYSIGDTGKDISVSDIISQLNDKWILVTGGEPLLQNDIEDFLSELIRKGFNVVLETNGSISLDFVPQNVHIIMDIKSPSSGMSDKNIYGNLDRLTFSDEVKIPVANEEDFGFAMDIIRAHNLTNSTNVSVSPVWDPSSGHTKISPEYLTELILKTGLPVRLNIQIHKLIGIK